MIQWPTRGLRGKVFGLGAIMLLAVALAGHLTPKDVQAQTYPVKPITIVNPWGPGAIPDLFSRALSPQLSKLFGVPVDVVSKPGGSGIVGSHSVMAAAPDGYTVLADNPGTSSMYLGWDVKLPYKEEEKTYMIRAAVVKQVIVVPTSTPWKTLGDMEQAIRKDPESFCWPTAGATYVELTFGQFRAALAARGIKVGKTKLVPIQSGTEALKMMASGDVHIYSCSYPMAAPLVNAGKLRIIAVNSPKRCKFYPEVPTTVEQGFPNMISEYWIGYTGPKGLAKNVVQKWIDVIKTIVDDPANVAVFDKLTVEAAFMAGDDFRKFVMDEAKEIKSVKVIKPTDSTKP